MAEPVTTNGSGPGGERIASPRPRESASIGEVVEFVTEYAKQETIDPIKGAGRWLGYGVAASLLLGVGLSLLLLGLLRLLQTEWNRSATGSLSWLSYLIVVVVGGAVLALAMSRINRSRLGPDSTHDKER